MPEKKLNPTIMSDGGSEFVAENAHEARVPGGLTLVSLPKGTPRSLRQWVGEKTPSLISPLFASQGGERRLPTVAQKAH